jgi:hypothetical protein
MKQFFLIDTTISDSSLVDVNDIWSHVMECIPSIKEVTLKAEDGSFGRLVPNLKNYNWFSCQIPVNEVPDDPITINTLIECVKSYFQKKEVYIGAEVRVRCMIEDGAKVRIFSLS